MHQQDQVSTTDPDATYATKGGTPARLGYYDNYLVDNRSCVIVGVQATAARMSQETVAAQDMITRFAEWQGREPASVAADATYGNGEFLQWLMERGITPYMRTRDSALRKNNPLYGPDRFTYLPESNSYLCPCWPTTQLRRFECQESNPCLHRKPQALRCVFAKGAMHHGPVQVSRHPHPRARPATRPRLSQHARLRARTTAKKKGGSALRGTQESDRTASLALTQDEVCSRAVLPGGGCPEHQTTGPLPQPSAKASARRDDLVSNPRKKLFLTAVLTSHQLPLPSSPFSTPTPDSVS